MSATRVINVRLNNDEDLTASITFRRDDDNGVWVALVSESRLLADPFGTGRSVGIAYEMLGDILNEERQVEQQSRLYDSADASVWAKEFCKVAKTLAVGADLDEGWVNGWFANAMQTAIDHDHRSRCEAMVPQDLWGPTVGPRT